MLLNLRKTDIGNKNVDVGDTVRFKKTEAKLLFWEKGGRLYANVSFGLGKFDSLLKVKCQKRIETSSF